MKKRNNTLLYIIFVVIIIIIITVFILFFTFFSKIDKHEYVINEGSIIFDNDFGYIKIEGNAKIVQRLDGNYYIYEQKDDTQYKYKIGNTAVVYNEADNNIYLYGKAYQVFSNWDVETVEGETKINSVSPTKFYKLADRKYLIVDNTIKSLNDTIINARGYLIVELDKQGNATFANNELNFKAIKPVVLSSSMYNFDIANEKLEYDKDSINLKNIIGSTNEYNERKKEENDDKNSNNQNNQTETDYYDNYLKEVVNSVNNLATSVEKINDNTNKNVTIDHNSTYYDISKWIALRSVSKSISTITLEYNVFDPNNEYQAVFARIKNYQGITKTIYVNKNNTSYIIRDLLPDSEYTVSFGYQSVSSSELMVVDEVIVKTEKPNYSINLDKIKILADEEEYELDYTLNIDKKYTFNKAKIYFYKDNVKQDEKRVLCSKKEDGCDIIIDSSGKCQDKFIISSLGIENKITLEEVEVCSSEGNCNVSNIKASYKFFGD